MITKSIAYPAFAAQRKTMFGRCFFGEDKGDWFPDGGFASPLLIEDAPALSITGRGT